MKVVHVITKGDVGGAQTHVAELAAAQIAAGLEVHVVAGSAGPALDRCRASGVATSVVPELGASRTRLWQREALRAVRDELAAAGPDIVHAHSSNAGLLARLACRRLGVACVYTAHGWPFQRGAAWKQRIVSVAGELVGGRLGDGVICLTEAELARARRAGVVRRDRVWVVPNGLADVAPTMVRRHDPAATPALVMVARFAPPKRQRELIDALAEVRALPWTMAFVGDGPDLEACRAHGTATLGDRVQFLGHRDDVAELLARHDVLVLWSAYEGLPVSILEGMRAGLACVASDLPGVRELARGGGVLTAATSDELVAAVAQLVGDASVRSALGGAARRDFESRFAIEVIEQQVRAVYEWIVTRRG